MCPNCIAEKWSNYECFITEKHNPYCLPLALDEFRSVVSCEVVDNKKEVAKYIAMEGKWIQNTKNKEFCVYVDHLPGTIAGSAVIEREPRPSYEMSGLLVAKAMSDPHIYCINKVEFQVGFDAGKYVDFPHCSHPGCKNITKPGEDKCIEHLF
jgi:hypothetical protein